MLLLGAVGSISKYNCGQTFQTGAFLLAVVDEGETPFNSQSWGYSLQASEGENSCFRCVEEKRGCRLVWKALTLGIRIITGVVIRSFLH